MATSITSSTDTSGNQVYSVDTDENDITLATAGTYVDKNIKFVINCLDVSVDDIQNSESKCIVFSKILDNNSLNQTILS